VNKTIALLPSRLPDLRLGQYGLQSDVTPVLDTIVSAPEYGSVLLRSGTAARGLGALGRAAVAWRIPGRTEAAMGKPDGKSRRFFYGWVVVGISGLVFAVVRGINDSFTASITGPSWDFWRSARGTR
jgi:hypothetical protein